MSSPWQEYLKGLKPPSAVASKNSSPNVKSTSSSSSSSSLNRGIDVASTHSSPRVPQPYLTPLEPSHRFAGTDRVMQTSPRTSSETIAAVRVASLTSPDTVPIGQGIPHEPRGGKRQSNPAPQNAKKTGDTNAAASSTTVIIKQKISWMRQIICSNPTACIVLAMVLMTFVALAISMSLILITQSHAVVLTVLYVILVICFIRFWHEPIHLLVSVFVLVVAAALIPDPGRYVAEYYDNLIMLYQIDNRLREHGSSIHEGLTHLYRISRDCENDMTTVMCHTALLLAHTHGTAAGKGMLKHVSNDMDMTNVEVKIQFPVGGEYTLTAAHLSREVTQLSQNIAVTNVDSAMMISSAAYERKRNVWIDHKQNGEKYYSCTYAAGMISQIFNVLGLATGKVYNWAGLGKLDPWAVTMIEVVRASALGTEKFCQGRVSPPKSDSVMRVDPCISQYCKFGTKYNLSNITAAFMGGTFMQSNTNQTGKALKYQVRVPPSTDSNASVSLEEGGNIWMNYSDGMKIVQFLESTQMSLDFLPDAAHFLQSVNMTSNVSLISFSAAFSDMVENGSPHPEIDALLFTSETPHWNDRVACKKGEFLNRSTDHHDRTCTPPPHNDDKQAPPHEPHSYQETIKTGVLGFMAGAAVHAYGGAVIGAASAVAGVVSAAAATVSAVTTVVNTAGGLASTQNALSLILMLAGRR